MCVIVRGRVGGVEEHASRPELDWTGGARRGHPDVAGREARKEKRPEVGRGGGSRRRLLFVASPCVRPPSHVLPAITLWDQPQGHEAHAGMAKLRRRLLLSLSLSHTHTQRTSSVSGRICGAAFSRGETTKVAGVRRRADGAKGRRLLSPPARKGAALLRAGLPKRGATAANWSVFG